MTLTLNNIRRFHRTYVDPHRLRHGDGDWPIIRSTSKTSLNIPEEMLAYCKQDVAVTTKLWDHIVKQNYPESAALKLEHDFALAINKQIRAGVPFDVDACLDLVDDLTSKTKQT